MALSATASCFCANGSGSHFQVRPRKLWKFGASLRVFATLRNDSEPMKKRKQKEDLLAELEDEIQPFLELQRETAMKVRTMRHYECMYLVHEKHADALQEVVKKYTDFVKQKKGRIWRLNDWGMRRLAYKIRGTWRANYILMNIEIPAETINEFNMLLEKDDRVIRHMIMTRKKAISEPCPPPEELPPTRKELLEAELSDEDDEEDDEENQEEDDEGGNDLDDEDGNEEDEAVDEEEDFDLEQEKVPAVTSSNEQQEAGAARHRQQ